LAEPFDLGYRMSNVVSVHLSMGIVQDPHATSCPMQIFQMTVALIMVPIAPLCAIIAIIMLFWTYSSYKFQM
jgi:hypothetical protein